MTGPSLRIARRSVIAGAGLALAGCSSLLTTPPGHLYRLTPVRSFTPGLPHIHKQLVVELPQAEAGIDSNRVALSKSPLSLDYFADSEWTDQLPRLIQNLLIASFENSGAINAVDPGSSGLRADLFLRTEIRHFEAVYDTGNGPPEVWVEIVARLTAARPRAVLAATRFEQRVRSAATDIPAIIAAFNSAGEAVLRDTVVWTLRNAAFAEG